MQYQIIKPVFRNFIVSFFYLIRDMDAMTLSGTKVECFERLDEDVEKVIVGKIVEIQRHPDARTGATV